jgi:hypothetical protein
MIKVLCLAKESPDAQRLLNYRAVKTARGVSMIAFVVTFIASSDCDRFRSDHSHMIITIILILSAIFFSFC